METNTAEASSNVELGSTPYTVTCGVPQINCLDDIWHYNQTGDKILEQVVGWVTLNPDTEHIYRFEMKPLVLPDDDRSISANSWLKNCIRSLQSNEQMDCIIAGSYALWTLTYMMYGYKNPGWKANDIDMFLLNRAQHARHSPSGGLLDIVHTTDKTPEEVITNFDLPCCRVAFSPHTYTFYVSIHALYSIVTQKVLLPRYLKKDISFRQVLGSFEMDLPSNRSVTIVKMYHDKLIQRMAERVQKYQSRGFSFQWYNTDYILPWIKQRFCYVDFDTTKDPFPKPLVMDTKITDLIRQKERILKLVKRLALEDPSYERAVKIHSKELEAMIGKNRR